MIARRDDRGMSDEQRDLAASEIHLAERLARSMARRRREDPEEYVRAAHLGLVTAARTFDESRGYPFGASVVKNVRWTIGLMFRERRRDRRHRDHHLDVADFEPADHRPAVEPQLFAAEEVARLMDGLEGKARAIVEGHYFGGKEIGELAAELGICLSHSSELHGKALAFMRARAEGRQVFRPKWAKRSKVDAANVVEIRRRYAAGESSKSLGHEFGVHCTSIINIVSRKTWANVPDPTPEGQTA